MIVIPVLTALFFISLLNSGLPTRVPTAVVDMDQSPMSRSMIRSLDAQQLVHVTEKVESYDAALRAVRQGRVYGFYVIPAQFQRDALSGRTPTIDYYSNMSYYVPGTFSFKGYKTIAVQASAGIVMKTAEAKGATAQQVKALIQPVVMDINPVANPWTDYSLYLTPSFLAGVLQLMILLVTIMTITYEIKLGTARRWLQTAHGSILLALFGKLAPQTVVWWTVGLFTQWLMYGVAGFPITCSLWVMIAAMLIYVPACQALGVFISCIFPNPRLGLSMGALLGILAFSLAGFSFPVENMYGALAVFSYILPVRYYFLIHINEALNGYGLYYVRWDFVALLLFCLAGPLLVYRLKKAMQRCVYVP